MGGKEGGREGGRKEGREREGGGSYAGPLCDTKVVAKSQSTRLSSSAVRSLVPRPLQRRRVSSLCPFSSPKLSAPWLLQEPGNASWTKKVWPGSHMTLMTLTMCVQSDLLFNDRLNALIL